MKIKTIEEFLRFKESDGFKYFNLYKDDVLLSEGDLTSIITVLNQIMESAVQLLEPISSTANFTIEIPIYSMEIKVKDINEKEIKIKIISELEKYRKQKKDQ